MKKILLASFFVISIFKAHAQVTLEHTYPAVTNATAASFVYIHLSEHEDCFLYLNYDSSAYTLYNINHSIKYAGHFPIKYSNNNYTVFSFSSKLFDCDSTTIEYEMQFSKPHKLVIYRTDSTALFSADSAMAINGSGGPSYEFRSIVSTSYGTKMILSMDNGMKKVYSLCGTVPTGYSIAENPTNPIGIGNAYPNPSVYSVSIPYHLPIGETKGQIDIYDTQGKMVKKYMVDGAFDNITLSTTDLPAGEYYYDLKTSSGYSEGKKMVKIK